MLLAFTLVCPLCAASLGKDVTGHFMVQHASSLKHRRKSWKSGFWTGGSAMLGKELHRRGREDTYESAPDPLLSPLICSLSIVEPKGIKQDDGSVTHVPVTCDAKSSDPSLHCEKAEGNICARVDCLHHILRFSLGL